MVEAARSFAILGVPVSEAAISGAPTRWTGVWALFKGERLLTHNVLVGVGTIAAGLLGVGFQSMASHQLRPADFGAVFAVVTLITFIGLPAGAFTLLMAREASRGLATGHQAAAATLLRKGNRTLLITGLALAAAVVLATPLLSAFLSIPNELLWVAAIGVPFGLALPLLIGEFQGEQRFVAYVVLSTGQAALKLGAAVVLGLVFGPLGIVGGITIATIVIYLIAKRMLRRKFSIRANLSWWRPAAGYLAVILPSTLALGVLLSSDVLLVKHYFPTQAAGEYSVVAALGRAVFWGASAIAIVLFPKITFRSAQGKSGLELVAASLVMVALGGVAGYVLLSIASVWLLSAFAGSGYTGAAGYLAWYTVGMVMLGGAAVLIATQQSRGRPAFLAVLLPLAILEPVLIALFHQTLMQVVQVVDISMLLVIASLAALYFAQERARSSIAPVKFLASAGNMAVQPLQGNQ